MVSPQRQIIPHLLVSDGTRPTTLTLAAAHMVTFLLGSACGRTAHLDQAGLADGCICCFTISTVCRHQPKPSPVSKASDRSTPKSSISGQQHQHQHENYSRNRKLCPNRTHMSRQGQKKEKILFTHTDSGTYKEHMHMQSLGSHHLSGYQLICLFSSHQLGLEPITPTPVPFKPLPWNTCSCSFEWRPLHWSLFTLFQFLTDKFGLWKNLFSEAIEGNTNQ